jgi:hypothetical protein
MAGRIAYYGGIVRDGLILNLDAAKRDSYPGSGTVWRDIVGSNSGTLTNGPTFSSENGGSIVFDGVNDFIEIYYSGSLITDSYTFSFFAKHNGERDTRRTMLGLSNNGDFAYKVFNMQIWDTNTQYLSFFGDNNSFTSFSFNLDYDFQYWNHFTAINTPSSIKIYVNGQLKSTINNPRRGTFDRIWIGTRSGQHWKGWIPDLKIYNRELSQSEVLQNYNATKSRFGI